MPPLAIVAALAFMAFTIGGILGALMKFQLGLEAVAAFFVLALVITGIATAIRREVGWVGIFPTALLAGLLLFTLAFLA